MFDLVKELENKNIKISLKQNNLEINFDGEIDNEILIKLKANKEKLIDFLAKHSNADKGITSVMSMQNYPVSHAQKRLWIQSQIEENSKAYHICNQVELNGDYDVTIFEAAILKVIQRHEILRTIFKLDDEGKIRQWILESENLNFKVDHIDFTNEKEPFTSVAKYIKEDNDKIFDLENGPLLRISFLKLADKHYVFYYNMHHIITDGWSLKILERDLFAYYKSIKDETKWDLKDLRIQYKDYASWQLSAIDSGSYLKHKNFWINQLAGDIPRLDLPSFKLRPKVMTYDGQLVKTYLSPELTDKIKLYCKENGGSLFMGLLSILKIVLNKYTGQQDITIGTAVAGREDADLEDQIGFYVNTLVLRTQINPEKDYMSFFESVKKSTLEAFSHQIYPFDILISDLNLSWDISRNSLFDIMVTFQNIVDTNSEIEIDESSYNSIENLGPRKSNFDLDFEFKEVGNALSFSITYNKNIYDGEMIENLINHFKELARKVFETPTMVLADIEYLSANEKKQLLLEFNNTSIDYPKDKTIIDLFETQVKSTPDTIAVVFEDSECTYSELNKQSNELGAYLREKYDIKPDDLIGIKLERSTKMLVAILGILKSGAAYVPIDPAYPQERINYIEQNSNSKLVIDEKELELFYNQEKKYSDSNLEKINTSKDLAYIIYTSGSTGNPKGVMIENRSVVNFLYGMTQSIILNPDDKLLAITSISFDIAVLELFWTLVNGITIRINKNNSIGDFDRFVEFKAKTLDFSMFYFSSVNENVSNKYGLIQETVQYADENEYSAVWFPERHFHEFGGIFPNPSLLGAAFANTTKNIEIRSGSVVLPLHDVVRVAEEWSVVDNLSNGRVALSIASGWHPDDFVFKPENYLDKQKIMYDQIEELKTIWKGNTFKRKNGLNEEVELKIYPKPINPNLEIYITSGGNAETFRSAGKIGAHILTHLLGQEISELKNNIIIYKQALLENGFSVKEAKISLMIHTFIGKENSEVEEIVKEPFKQYLKTSAGLIKNIAKDLDKDLLNDQDIETILDIAFQRYWKNSALLGTVKSCLPLLNEICNIGVTELACLIDFGIDEKIIVDNLENLTKLKSHFISAKNKKEDNGFTSIQITPSYLEALLDDANSTQFIKSLKNIIVGGENFTTALLSKIRQKSDAAVYNMYGPTETTIWSTFQKIDPNVPLNIGKPIQNTQVYILDSNKKLCPPGVNGELYIGGDGLSRGYYNQDELTKEKFIALDSINKNKKFYRTGDVARWLPNGTLDFLGRNDTQVKLNGFRIELGEIEQLISNQDSISQSIVVVKERGNEKFMVAYFVSKKDIDKKVLQNNLSKVVPDYMLPRYYIQLEAIPLTPNGKVDRNSLPGVDEKDLIKDQYVAPRTKEEELIVEVWSQVLKCDKISIKDSFYNLGGDSIKSIRIISLLKQKGYTLKVEQVLRNPIVEDLAKLVKNNTINTDQSEVKGEVELTPIQHYFFESEVISNKNHHNQSVILSSKSKIDSAVLEQSIAALVRHHDALRMVFKLENQSWKQYNEDTSGIHYKINFYDLSKESNELEALDRIGQELQSSFDISSGVLFHVGHFRLSDGDRLGLIIHHLVIDGVSWRILFEDLSNIYSSLEAGNLYKLPLKTDSYKHWASSMKVHAQSNEMQVERLYWEEVSKESIPLLRTDTISTENVWIKDKKSYLILDSSLTQKLLTQVHDIYKTEINDILLTGLALAIKDVFGIDKTVLKIEGHGREEIIDGVDIGRTVGWFTSVYPFVLDISDSVGHELVTVKESLRKIPNKGVGYAILHYLDKRFKNKLNPSIEFNYLGDFGDNVGGEKEKPLFDFSSESIGAPTNKQTEELLYVSGMIVSGELNMGIQYSSQLFNPETLEKLITSFKNQLINLIEGLSNTKKSQLTPSDLIYKNISFPELLELDKNNNVQDIYELSPLQQGLYYSWLLDSSSYSYFNQATYRLYAENFDIQVVEKAYENLIKRHDILRTSFSNSYGTVPLQIVHKQGVLDFSYEQVPDFATGEEYLLTIKEKDKSTGFDFNNPTQMRLKIVDLGNNYYEFIWSYHHILMDGWCLNILINDFNTIANAIAQNQKLILPDPPKYSEYIKWLSKLDKSGSLKYWKQYLSNMDAVIDVTFKKKKDKASKLKIGTESLQIDNELFQDVNKICQQIAITPNIFMQGVWGYLLSKYNNTQDVVFGSVVSGRPGELSDSEKMIGLFINTIPVRVKYTKEDTTKSMLQKLHLKAIESTLHHYVNLSDIQVQSSQGTDLIKTLFVYENYFVEENKNVSIDADKEKERSSIALFEQTNYDFNLIIVPSSSSLKIEFQYNSDLFDSGLIKNLVNHFLNIVKQFSSENAILLDKIDYLTISEKHQLLFDFNDTKVDYPKNKTVVDLFEEQVAKTPDTIAVVFEDVELTYKELNEKTNQLAYYLRENYNVKSDDLVGIKLDRSEKMLIAILGILKSGAAYVPIDVNYPQERISYIEKDSNSKIVIDEKELENFVRSEQKYSKENIEKINEPNDLAYVIYTSGTTGNPKGVMIENSNAVELIQWSKRKFDADKFEIIYAVTSYCFDLSVYELLYPLSIGKRIRILKNGLEIKHYLQIDKKVLLNTVPSLISKLLDDNVSFETVSILNMAGEQISFDVIERLPLDKIEAYNLYGPSEDTTYSTHFQIKENSTQNVSIGQPISNTQLYILDKNLEPLPIGSTGNIYLSGAGVARGYLNKPKLTAEKFVKNPFISGTRMYDTGDLGSWLPDGTVAFLGRKDHQVKIRGYRIELREIESIFYQYSQSIKQVVIEPKDVNGDKILIAYYVSDVIEDKVIIDHYLKDKLPVYMIPSFYVELHTLPLTPNGKIDRKALPNISGNDLIRREFIAPRNDLEKKLAAIWQEILRIEKVSITDNFFDIGGHSLKVILLVGLILKRLSAKVTIMQIFDHPDLKSQAQLISSSNKEIYFDIAKIKEEKNYDMTYEQKRIWLLSLDKKASITYNMSFHAELKGEFDFENFKKAVLSALDRHEILRTVFKEDENGEIKQWVLSTEELNFEIDQVDLRQDLNQEELVKDYIHKKSTTVFDLEKGPLLSVGYLLLEESRKVIVYNMYHIISDGWSMNVLVRDVTEFYNAYCENREPNLPVLNIQYKDYAAWQHNEVTNIKVKQQEEYWGKLFEKGIPKVKLPFEKQRPENFTHTGNRAKFRINKELMEGLTSISSKNKGSMYITFMTLVKLALYKYTGDEYNMVGSSFSTRNHNNLQNQIGFYVNNLPVFSTIKKEDTFQAVYESIKHTVLSVNSNSWFPLELLLKQIKYKHDKSFSGLFNVLVEFHQKNDYVENGDTAVEPIQEEIVFDYDFPCQFDFSLEFFENKNHIDGIMVYNKALFDENHIELFVKRFLNIIKQLTGQLEDLNLIKVADINLDIMKVADSTISKKTTILEENF